MLYFLLSFRIPRGSLALLTIFRPVVVGRLAAPALKAQIAGALKRQLAEIALCQLAVLPAIDAQLHPVAAGHLKVT